MKRRSVGGSRDRKIFRKTANRTRKRTVVPKDKVKEIIGRSPDYSDTLMMREWFELSKSKKLIWA